MHPRDEIARELCFILGWQYAMRECMEQEGDQVAFKNRVKLWLKSHQLDYKWMAEQCGVSEITVRNWMSQKPIPFLKEQLLERVMVQLPSTLALNHEIHGVEVEAQISLNINLSPDTYHSLELKARQRGISLKELVAQAITQLLDNESPPSPTLPARKVIIPPKD